MKQDTRFPPNRTNPTSHAVLYTTKRVCYHDHIEKNDDGYVPLPIFYEAAIIAALLLALVEGDRGY